MKEFRTPLLLAGAAVAFYGLAAAGLGFAFDVLFVLSLGAAGVAGFIVMLGRALTPRGGRRSAIIIGLTFTLLVPLAVLAIVMFLRVVAHSN